MLYRLYRPPDFVPLYAIEEACFQPPYRFERSYMRHLVSIPHAATWIAEQEGRMAGFAIAAWAQEIGGIVAYIETIEVAPDHRGCGVGGELLRRLEGSAQAVGAQTIWLHVDAENAVAIRLYGAHGYLCKGREENYYAPGFPALIYAKPLEADPPNCSGD
jgi:ribosomal-protein-alanine N-acetyltransferase